MDGIAPDAHQLRQELSSFLKEFVTNRFGLADTAHALRWQLHTLGHQPVVAEGASIELQSAAFFIPKGSDGASCRVDGVEFVDGTMWEQQAPSCSEIVKARMP